MQPSFLPNGELDIKASKPDYTVLARALQIVRAFPCDPAGDEQDAMIRILTGLAADRWQVNLVLSETQKKTVQSALGILGLLTRYPEAGYTEEAKIVSLALTEVVEKYSKESREAVKAPW